MAKSQLPKTQTTIRINKAKLGKSPVLWLIGAACMFFIGLVVLYWGYSTSRLPYWLDNAMSGSGILGFVGKEYVPGSIDEWDGVIDPELTSVVEDTEMEVTYAGFVEEIEVSEGGDKVNTLVLSDVDMDALNLEGSWSVSRVLTSMCLPQDSCDESVYLPGELGDVTEGSLVSVTFRKNWNDAVWEISKILVRNI